MPNLPYHLARLEGIMTRLLYRAALPWIARRAVRIPREVDFDVFAYSGESMLPEQVASLRSFLANVGRPRCFVIFSDGSYTPSSIRLLEGVDPVVEVRESLPSLPPQLPDKTLKYLTTHYNGKQLAAIMSLPLNNPALYTDSDVLFFSGASEIANLTAASSTCAFYLPDHRFSGDERLLLSPEEKESPANMGLLLLFRKLDWSLGLERFAMLEGLPNFFTGQTITHLCLHANGAVPFDPQKFILQADDEFGYADRYSNGPLAVRHYVNPIRHKFWAALAHQILK
jgi:hypothetical protein